MYKYSNVFKVFFKLTKPISLKNIVIKINEKMKKIVRRLNKLTNNQNRCLANICLLVKIYHDSNYN